MASVFSLYSLNNRLPPSQAGSTVEVRDPAARKEYLKRLQKERRRREESYGFDSYDGFSSKIDSEQSKRIKQSSPQSETVVGSVFRFFLCVSSGPKENG